MIFQNLQDYLQTSAPRQLHHRGEVAKDRASYLLDLAVAAPTEYTWAGLRADLAELYRAAGTPSVADFVLSPVAESEGWDS